MWYVSWLCLYLANQKESHQYPVHPFGFDPIYCKQIILSCLCICLIQKLWKPNQLSLAINNHRFIRLILGESMWELNRKHIFYNLHNVIICWKYHIIFQGYCVQYMIRALKINAHIMDGWYLLCSGMHWKTFGKYRYSILNKCSLYSKLILDIIN